MFKNKQSYLKKINKFSSNTRMIEENFSSINVKKYMKSIKDEHNLILQFNINDDITKYKYIKPLNVFQSIINSKVTNSLYWHLTQMKLIHSVYCDYDNYCNEFAKVNVYVNLTKSGYYKYKDVQEIIYNIKKINELESDFVYENQKILIAKY